MNSLKTSIILSLLLSLLSIFLFACATTKTVEEPPPFKVVGTTLAKEVEPAGDTAVPVQPTDEFSTLDSKVVAYVKLSNLSGKHTMRWDWYDPSGEIYYSTGDFPIQASSGKFSREADVWHKLSIQGDEAADQPGDWQVRVYLDDKFVEAKHFVLKEEELGLALPGAESRPYPEDWALVIGIEDYAHLPHVDYARRDALVVKEYFNKVLGVPEENTVTLIDSDATKGRIEGFIKQYLPANVSKDTTLYVYFAGHGAPDMKTGNPYLVPQDGDTRFLEQTGYDLKSFYQDLDNLHLKRVYVFLDSCFSGVAARAAEMLATGARPALVHVNDIQIKGDDVVSLSAASAGQVSNSYPEAKHGLFTYYLLKALGGEADANDDQWVSIKEIYTYVKTHVIRVARRHGAEQTPAITPSLDSLKDVAIGKVMR